MKNHKIFIFSIFILFLGCEDDFVPNNPLDPENPDYTPPIVTINSGPIENEVVDTMEVTFNYGGNQESMLFRTQLDQEGWSDWLSDNSASYSHLNEGAHRFKVQAMYTTGEESGIVEVYFIIDAVQGPALLFYPRRHITQIGEKVTFMVMAEEVTNLAATEFTFNFNPVALQVTDITSGTFFSSSGDALFFEDINQQNGTVTISAGFVGGEDPAVVGTGSIAIIEVLALQQGQTTLEFDGSEVFRDPEDVNISISETVSGLVQVE